MIEVPFVHTKLLMMLTSEQMKQCYTNEQGGMGADRKETGWSGGHS